MAPVGLDAPSKVLLNKLAAVAPEEAKRLTGELAAATNPGDQAKLLDQARQFLSRVTTTSGSAISRFGSFVAGVPTELRSLFDTIKTHDVATLNRGSMVTTFEKFLSASEMA